MRCTCRPDLDAFDPFCTVHVDFWQLPPPPEIMARVMPWLRLPWGRVLLWGLAPSSLALGIFVGAFGRPAVADAQAGRARKDDGD